MLKHVSFLILFFITCSTFACSCDAPDTINNKVFNEYQLIVKGNVLKVDTVNYKLIIHLKVELAFHGKADSIVKISTYPGGTACGITTKPNQTWLIFAYSNKNQFETGLCTRSKNINNPKSIVYDTKLLKNDLDFLMKHLKNKKNR